MFTNTRVVTLDPHQPTGEAVLVAGERIAAVGAEKQLQQLAPVAEVVDLGGKVLFPGFIEPHSHVMGYGLAESRAAVFYNRNLAPVRGREELLQLIREETIEREKQQKKGEWITGRGYAVDRWPDRSLLTRQELDEVAPDNPVALNDLGGHLLLCNSRALELGGVDRATPDRANGVIVRDDSGAPSGPLKDGAMLPVFSKIPRPTDAQCLEAARVAVTNMARLGITTVHHIRNWLPGGYGPEQIWPFVVLEWRGELPIRVWLMVEAYQNIAQVGDYKHVDALESLGLRTGFGHRVKVGPVKIIVDGWLDTRTSANYEPYADAVEMRGYTWREDPDDYKELVWRAHRAGFQLAIHCDGLRSTDIILDAYEEALRRLPRTDHRHRFEHLPVLTDEQIERIAALGASVCTVPSYRMEPWYKEMIVRAYGEERARRLAQRYRSLKQAGVHVFGGSDCHPCEEKWLSPLGQIHLYSVEGPLDEAEKFSREEAVRMFTTEAAKASFEEDDKGKIVAGALADMVVLSGDPLTVPDDDLLKIRVECTLVGGETVYRRGP
ncbi:MAG: amidohydrolase [Acidobacteriota bacterium]